jgi:arsenite/tail-anchored protein-transporting ATPase
MLLTGDRAMKFLDNPPRFLFFTGKGGVGKTSVACATALHLAHAGKSVLLVSTDPASNVGQVFGVTIGNTVTPIDAVPGLSALEIDPEQAANAYRERIIGPVRGLLPNKEILSITEQLSGSCTTEIASFNEFTSLLADESIFGHFDHVVFDTAPTGHTLRLLQLPGSWTDFLQSGKGDASCLGPLAGLEKHKAVYAQAVAALKDPAQTRMVLVSRPQRSALAETDRTHRELIQIGITGAFVVINGGLPPTSEGDDLTRALRDRENAALRSISPALAALPCDVLELKATNMVGVAALDMLFTPATSADINRRARATPVILDAPLAMLVDELAQGDHGLIMCMGKGGVGKTTIAAAIAINLAARGKVVLLTTTDPAAHLTETLQGNVPGLQVERIDPVAATQEYRDRIMATKGKDLDDTGRANLAEDLLSPCTEEVAVFGQFSKAVNQSRGQFVVIDTAPTGHTLLLLDAAGSYHREITRQMNGFTSFTTPLMHLQDRAQTKVILITLAETTPVLEAEGLQEDLERAGIHPWAWVVNSSIAASHPDSAFLRQRAAAEIEQINRVLSEADRIAIIPLLTTEPVGEERLAALTNLSLQPV